MDDMDAVLTKFEISSPRPLRLCDLCVEKKDEPRR
jgi:hypothetical protein